MSRFLYENHRGSTTSTLLNVLGVLNALHVLNVLYVLHVLNMLMDASLACWALFINHPVHTTNIHTTKGDRALGALNRTSLRIPQCFTQNSFQKKKILKKL